MHKLLYIRIQADADDQQWIIDTQKDKINRYE
jgi:hypothetical protein